MIGDGRYAATLRTGMGDRNNQVSNDEFSKLKLTDIVWSFLRAAVSGLLKDDAVAGSYALTTGSSLRSPRTTSMDFTPRAGNSSPWSTAPPRHAAIGRSRCLGRGSV